MKRNRRGPPKGASKPRRRRDEEDEDVVSGEESPQPESEVSYQEEEVDVNEKRLAMARKVIEDARRTLGETKRVKASMVAGGEAVSASEEDEDVGEYLQGKISEAKLTRFVPHFAQIEECFQKRGRTFDQLVLKGHTKPVTACRFSPVTNDLVTVGKDGAILFFDFASGFKRRLLNAGAPKHGNGHANELLCVDISSDGKLLATAGKDRVIKVWDLGAFSKDLATMKKNIARGDFVLKARNSALLVAHRKLSTESHTPEELHKSPGPERNGSRHQSADKEPVKVRLQSPEAQRNGGSHSYVEKHPDLVLLANLEGHRDAVTGVRFRVGSHELISVSVDRSFKLWDADKGVLLETLYGHRSDILDVDVMGAHAVTCGFDKSAIVFKIDKETQMVFDEQLFSLDCVRAINQHFFVTGSQDGSVAFWNVGKKRPLKVFDTYRDKGWVSAIATHFNSDFLVTAGVDADIWFWHTRAEDVKKWGFEPRFSVAAAGVVTGMAVSAGGEYLAVVEGPENRLGRWTVVDKAASRIRVLKIKQHL